jgi:hypothetical protein
VACPPLDRVRGSAILLRSKSEEPLELLLRCRGLIRVLGKEIENLVSSVLFCWLCTAGCRGFVRVASEEIALKIEFAFEDIFAQVICSPCGTKSAVKRHSRVKN